MLIKNIMEYSKHHIIKIGSEQEPRYYLFDYDERSYNINMEFQHFHTFYEMHILLDTSARHFIEGTPYELNCFDIVCHKPTLLHKSEYFPGDPSKRLIIQFSTDVFPSLFENETSDILKLFGEELPIYRFDKEKLPKLFAPLNEIYEAGEDPKGISEFFIHIKFMEFLCILASMRTENIYRPGSIEGSPQKMYEIASYIHANYAGELSLSSLAEKYYLSPYYLSHQFKTVTGFNLITYIQMTRIKNAQQMLLFTRKKVTDIAEECGFASFSQFNRMFNKFAGVSPREYRNGVTSNSLAKL